MNTDNNTPLQGILLKRVGPLKLWRSKYVSFGNEVTVDDMQKPLKKALAAKANYDYAMHAVARAIQCGKDFAFYREFEDSTNISGVIDLQDIVDIEESQHSHLYLFKLSFSHGKDITFAVNRADERAKWVEAFHKKTLCEVHDEGEMAGIKASIAEKLANMKSFKKKSSKEEVVVEPAVEAVPEPVEEVETADVVVQDQPLIESAPAMHALTTEETMTVQQAAEMEASVKANDKKAERAGFFGYVSSMFHAPTPEKEIVQLEDEPMSPVAEPEVALAEVVAEIEETVPEVPAVDEEGEPKTSVRKKVSDLLTLKRFRSKSKIETAEVVSEDLEASAMGEVMDNKDQVMEELADAVPVVESTSDEADEDVKPSDHKKDNKLKLFGKHIAETLGRMRSKSEIMSSEVPDVVVTEASDESVEEVAEEPMGVVAEPVTAEVPVDADEDQFMYKVPENTLHQGILKKQSNFYRNWNERYFALSKNEDGKHLLTYFRPSDKMKPAGQVVLTEKLIVTPVNGTKFTVVDGGVNYMLMADSEEDRLTWLSVLKLQ